MMARIPADSGDPGWDDEEREALAGLEPELDALRARHARAPELELLRAAEAEVLPDDIQSAGARYLAEDRWSRALVAGLTDADASLDPADQSRLLARIQREARPSARSRPSWIWPPLAVAAAAVVVIIGAVVWAMRPGGDRTVAPDRTVAVQTPASSPRYVMALAKPEVKLSAAALTWRGAGRPGDLTADLKPGLDAFRRDDFGSARRALAALTEKYAASVEVFFYLGVSQLFLDDARSALDSFATAATRADAMFAPDITWYRSIAEERLGRIDAARTGLTELCGGTTPRAADACAALGALK